MMLICALVVSAACVLASAERLRKVLTVRWLERLPPAARWVDAPPDTLEHELGEHHPLDATALDSVAFEVDHLLSRWARVPRMAARVCSTSAFLLAAAELRRIMLDVGAAPGALEASAEPVVIGAVQIVAAGLCGSALCLALGREARVARQSESAAVERALEGLGRGELFGRSDVEA